MGSVAGALQTEVGLAVTKLSGGRYENIAAQTRFVTLMPEIAKQIAESNLRQTHQYRITYERPGKDPKPQQDLGRAHQAAHRHHADPVDRRPHAVEGAAMQKKREASERWTARTANL